MSTEIIEGIIGFAVVAIMFGIAFYIVGKKLDKKLPPRKNSPIQLENEQDVDAYRPDEDGTSGIDPHEHAGEVPHF